ncbi:8-oxo-dGTP diphosphatase [Lysinibacillus capsici]|uniref:NUDIX hydrolase n=1 Tax=Lysinibacillus capsici TaxID=2115968 RepID=UPI002E1ADE66|nr:8-oxo-dGTP diphosphatase [Lysinibacillus capsici]
MIKYTIGYLKYKNQILLLNRNKAPNMGLWNGVGGKIEINETPKDSFIREAFEETGIILSNPKEVGTVIWNSNRGNGGMYVFFEEFFEKPFIEVNNFDEGILAWKEIDWIMNTENKGIVPNIKYYLKEILENKHDLIHHFMYINGNLLDYKICDYEYAMKLLEV